MLDDYERNLNDSRTYSDRMTMQNQALISAADLSDLKRQLADKTKKIKEFDQLFNQQNIKYEMECKKTNILMNENKKLKEQ